MVVMLYQLYKHTKIPFKFQVATKQKDHQRGRKCLQHTIEHFDDVSKCRSMNDLIYEYCDELRTTEVFNG